MITLKDEDLSKYTTVKIGGTASRLFVPESTAELLDIINTDKPKYFIGGGSNLLINNRVFDAVVSLKSFDTSIDAEPNGRYSVGGSVRLQKLIKQINDDGFGGIEYLCNVPGLVGGAVAMNAGTGRKKGKAISDYIVSVEAVRDGKIVKMLKDECDFLYRDSFFKTNPECIITSVLFEFPAMTQEETERAKEEKMRYYRDKQDHSYPNFGSVFRRSNYKIMHILKILKLGGKVCFSGKTVNWIINRNHGTYEDAIKTIKKAETLHKLLGQKIVREVIVWE